MFDNDYHIRGGGFTQGRSPLKIVVLGLITAVALVFCIFGLYKLVGYMLVARVDSSIVTITDDQAHSAISAQMPTLLNYFSGTADDAYNQLKDAGVRVFLNNRETSDNPDVSATGKEIVYLPDTASDEMLQTYNGSEFNDFNYDDLQNAMLGAWMMDISTGDVGTYIQFKYVNLAATSLNDEMNWLLAQQGLTGSGSQVLDQGVDSFGNSYITGTTTANNQTYYWRILSASFGDYYQGADTRKLPSSAAYVKLRIGSWDFIGTSALQSGSSTTDNSGATTGTDSTAAEASDSTTTDAGDAAAAGGSGDAGTPTGTAGTGTSTN